MRQLSDVNKIAKDFFLNKKFKKKLDNLPQKNITDKVLIFNTIRTFNKQLNSDLFLAHILAKLGATIYILIDEKGCFSHWDSYQKHNENVKKLKYPVSQSFVRHFLYNRIISLYNHENIKIIDYSDVIDKEITIEKKIKTDDFEIDLEKCATASTRRYTETGGIDYSDESHKKFYELSLRNANISYQMGKFIKNKINPDVFLTVDSLYSMRFPCFEYLRNSGVICFVCGGGGATLNSFRIRDEHSHIANRSKEWIHFKSKKLDDQMKKKVIDYLDKRRDHQSEDNIIHFKYITKGAEIDTKKSKGYDYVFSAFPNVVWDGDGAERNHIFSSVIDWLIQTITFIKDKKNLFLYVRCHPSEVTQCKGSKLVEELLFDNIKDLGNIQNVEIISSKTNLDTYHFMDKYADIGLVYDGTLGLELPYMGIPTLMAGDGRINVKGINLGVKTRKQYFDYISEPQRIKKDFVKEFDEEILYKYVYWNQFQTAYYMPIFDKSGRKLRLEDVFLSDINIWQNAEFKRTIERVLQQKI
jgi:hypothetical protein